MPHEQIVALICDMFNAFGVEPKAGRIALLDVILSSVAWEAELAGSDDPKETQVALIRELVADTRAKFEADNAAAQLASGLFSAH